MEFCAVADIDKPFCSKIELRTSLENYKSRGEAVYVRDEIILPELGSFLKGAEAHSAVADSPPCSTGPILVPGSMDTMSNGACRL